MGTIHELTKDAVKVGPDFFDNASKQSQRPSLHVAGPVPEARIQDAEKQLGVAFPREYRDFIATHGAFLGNGLELYGLTPEKDDKLRFFSDIVQQTELMTSAPNTDVGRNYIAISSDGMGANFLIDTDVPEGLRIVVYGVGFDFIQVATSLDEFCRNMLIDTYATFLNEVIR